MVVERNSKKKQPEDEHWYTEVGMSTSFLGNGCQLTGSYREQRERERERTSVSGTCEALHSPKSYFGTAHSTPGPFQSLYSWWLQIPCEIWPRTETNSYHCHQSLSNRQSYWKRRVSFGMPQEAKMFLHSWKLLEKFESYQRVLHKIFSSKWTWQRKIHSDGTVMDSEEWHHHCLGLSQKDFDLTMPQAKTRENTRIT